MINFQPLPPYYIKVKISFSNNSSSSHVAEVLDPALNEEIRQVQEDNARLVLQEVLKEKAGGPTEQHQVCENVHFTYLQHRKRDIN